MNKRIVLLFVLELLLCNAYNVVATPTTSLSDATQEEIIGITWLIWLGYCILLCFFVRYIMPFSERAEHSKWAGSPSAMGVSVIVGIFIAFFIVLFLKTQISISTYDVETLFVIMCVSSIFIMGLGDIILVPEEERNKKIKQLNIKTKKVSFVLSIPSFIIAYLIWQFGIIEMVLVLFVIPITIAYKWWRLKTCYEKG